MFLEPCLGNCSWTRCLTLRNLAWEPVLGLGSLFLGTRSWEHCLVTCSWELSLGNLFLETLPVCFKPVHWDLAREPGFRNFAWEPCLGTCPSEPCLGFCSCFQPCLQMLVEISLCKLFLESCSWEHEQPGTMLGNVFVGTVLATYCSEPSWRICSWNLNQFLGTCSSNPCLRTCSCEACLKKPVLGHLAWDLFVETLLGNLFPRTLLGNLRHCSWNLGNLFLGTCSWEPCLATVSGTLAWEPVLGNLTWKSFLVTLLANLFLVNLTGNLVLRVAEDLNLTLLGKKFPSKFQGRGSQAGIQEEVPKQG